MEIAEEDVTVVADAKNEYPDVDCARADDSGSVENGISFGNPMHGLEFEDPDERVVDEAKKSSIVVQSILYLMCVSHFLGNGYIILRRFFVRGNWPNDNYEKDFAWVFYVIHYVAVCLFMYACPAILVYRFEGPWLGVYFGSWFAAGVITVIPLLQVEKSRETLGVGVHVATGIVANLLQVMFLIALIIPNIRFYFKKSWYFAFHMICGYNIVAAPYKNMLADYPAANAAAMWGLLVLHVACAFFLMKPYAWGPMRSPLATTKEHLVYGALALGSALPFVSVPAAWFAT